MSIFGMTMRSLREKAGLSQNELAEKLSVSHNIIRNTENGYMQPNDSFTEKVALFFGVTSDYLNASVAGIEPAFLPRGYCCVNIFSQKAIESGVLRESDVIAKIVVSTSDEHEDYIAMVVTDNYLSAHRIKEGDTVVISRRSIANDGDVCLISFPDKSIGLRKLYRDGTKIHLFTDSMHKNLPQVTYDISDTGYKIWGKVVKLIVKM